MGLLPYRAPWSAGVKALTALGAVVLAGEAALVTWLVRAVPGVPEFLWWIAPCFLTILGICALLTVRGYGFEADDLVVERLLWTQRLPLSGLRKAVLDPRALRFTFKRIGNDGLFAITGWRHVDGYGWCRVFATDPRRAVVLVREDRNYIVTPDRPDDFVREAQSRLGR